MKKTTPVLDTLREWRDFEYSRTQRITPILDTLDAMIARAEKELAAGQNKDIARNRIESFNTNT